MELREFAEQVVFGTTLEEKLARPGELTDSHPGGRFEAPAQPGRPPALHFKDSRDGGGAMPGVRELEYAAGRGRLLHFFANHELLATELMALVLLRFPDAPAPFRQGVLRTLRDEQEHTRLYVERMRASGIAFGDLPVSGYFWRMVAPMENPIDFVARLSLTFEQANLDHCREFGRRFAIVGDTDTASLLEGIYRDEIAHVAHGLKWFRRWKNPDESDWEAFCRQLHFPLSPQRAKGPIFNAEGRRAAGLDPEFIQSLEVFARSRGRTPGVFVFNPFSPAAIEASVRPGSPIPQLTRDQQAFVDDLGGLVQFLGRRDDLVLAPSVPSSAHLATLQSMGFPPVEFVALSEGRVPESAGLSERKLGSLKPWCWGPDSLALLGGLAGQVTGDTVPIKSRFHPGIAELHSKSWGTQFLARFLEQEGGRSPVPLGGLETAGVSVRSLADAEAAIREIRARGHHRVVVKEDFGFAGAGQIRLWEPEVLPAQTKWMAAALDRGATLVVEPWLERLRDVSMQLERGPASQPGSGSSALRVVGFTGLVNDLRGQFMANWADADWNRRVPSGVLDAWRMPQGGSPMAGSEVVALFHRMAAALEPELASHGYEGPLGVDAFVYRDHAGTVRLKPFVELNPRYTMGRLTLELMSHVAPGRRGAFRLVTSGTAARSGFSTLTDLVARLRTRHPLVLGGAPLQRIESGIVCLNDPATATRVLALLEVGPRIDPARVPWGEPEPAV